MKQINARKAELVFHSISRISVLEYKLKDRNKFNICSVRLNLNLFPNTGQKSSNLENEWCQFRILNIYSLERLSISIDDRTEAQRGHWPFLFFCFLFDVIKATFLVTLNAKCLLSSLMSANKKIVNSVPLLTCTEEGQQHSAHLFEILACL